VINPDERGTELVFLRQGTSCTGKDIQSPRDGLQQIFQCGKLRPECLNNIFFGCFILSLLPVWGDTYVDIRQLYILTRVAAPCLFDRKKSY